MKARAKAVLPLPSDPAQPDDVAGGYVQGEALRQPLGIREGLDAHGERLARRRALALRGAARPIVSIGNDRA